MGTHEDSPHNQWELTNDGKQPCKDVFPASHVRKDPWVCRGGNSEECVEGQVNSRLVEGARKEVEKKEEERKTQSWWELL